MLGAVSANAAEIRLRARSDVPGGIVRLGDVADVEDADPEAAARLRAVSLVPAPGAGKSVQIEFDTIRGRLAAQGFDLSQMEFSGSSLVIVRSGGNLGENETPRSVSVSDASQRQAEDLASKAVAKHLREMAAHLGNLRVETNMTPAQAQSLVQAASSKLDVTGGVAPWTGEQKFQLSFFDRNGKRTEMGIQCRVGVLPHVLVPRNNLPKGHILQEEDLTWKQCDAPAAGKGVGLETLEAAIGRETKRSLRAGETILPADVRGIPLVRRGDIVTVKSRAGGIVVRMEAKAHGDGGLGETVKLVSLDGKRELQAQVTGYHETAVVGASRQGAAGNVAPGVQFVTGAR